MGLVRARIPQSVVGSGSQTGDGFWIGADEAQESRMTMTQMGMDQQDQHRDSAQDGAQVLADNESGSVQSWRTWVLDWSQRGSGVTITMTQTGMDQQDQRRDGVQDGAWVLADNESGSVQSRWRQVLDQSL